MKTFAIYINSTFSGYVSAVSYRQAKSRARAKFHGPVDVIGIIANCERVIPLA